MNKRTLESLSARSLADLRAGLAEPVALALRLRLAGIIGDQEILAISAGAVEVMASLPAGADASAEYADALRKSDAHLAQAIERARD